MSKEKRERAIAQNGNEGTHYTMTAEELQMLTETFTNDYVQQDVAKLRKETPVFSGVLKYFPNALKEVAKCSQAGNVQHDNGDKLFWDRSKSGDELDALARHLIDHGVNPIDTDGIAHLAKCAWRALAGLEKYLEGQDI